jgi:photosystem II stability/assembly factor-like uncharacterized protein
MEMLGQVSETAKRHHTLQASRGGAETRGHSILIVPLTPRLRVNMSYPYSLPVGLLLIVATPMRAVAQAQGWEFLKVETTASFRGLSVVSDRVIWASGTRGTVIRSVDGGTTWSVDSIPNGSTFDLRGIHATSDRVAHVAATAGRIWKTTDGGKIWSLKFQAADTSMFLDAIVFRNDRDGFALGDPMNGQFVILVTSDGGETWREAQGAARPIANDGEAAFAASGTSLVFIGSRFGWLGTGGTTARVYRTTDSGATWRAHNSAIPAKAGSGGVFSVAFADSLHGVVVGGDYEQPDSSARTAAMTVDGGATWTPPQQFPRGYRSGVAMHRTDAGHLMAIAVGTNGSDVSRDGGKTWTPLDATGFNAVQFAPSGVAFAVGARGRVARILLR